MVDRRRPVRAAVRCACVFCVLLIASALASQDPASRIKQLFSQAQNEESQGRIDSAANTYNAILKLDPNSAVAYESLGKLDFQESHYPEAVQAFRRALEINPQAPISRALLGISLYKVGDFQAASEELKTARRLFPTDKNTRLYLARSLFEVGDLGGAAKEFEELRREDPKNAEVLYALGQVYMKLAASTFDDLQKQAPDSYLIELLLGDQAETTLMHPQAIEHYRKAIAKKGSDARGLHYPLGHALYNDGLYQEALQEFRRELELNPYDYMASYEAAEILEKENPVEAVRLATQALEVKPDLAPALFVRGKALLSMGKATDAVTDLKRAASLNPNDALVHFQLARGYHQLGLKSDAQEEEALYVRLQQAAHLPKSPPGANN